MCKKDAMNVYNALIKMNSSSQELTTKIKVCKYLKELDRVIELQKSGYYVMIVFSKRKFKKITSFDVKETFVSMCCVYTNGEKHWIVWLCPVRKV